MRLTYSGMQMKEFVFGSDFEAVIRDTSNTAPETHAWLEEYHKYSTKHFGHLSFGLRSAFDMLQTEGWLGDEVSDHTVTPRMKQRSRHFLYLVQMISAEFSRLAYAAAMASTTEVVRYTVLYWRNLSWLAGLHKFVSLALHVSELHLLIHKTFMR